MITEISQIEKGAVLLDVSALVSVLFTELRDKNTGQSNECHFLLERCVNSQVHGYIAPEGVSRLWKIFSADREGSKPIVLPQMQPDSKRRHDPARRMKAFARSPFHILSISSSTIEKAAKLWERTGAGIDACIAFCAFKETVQAPYVVVTANSHYDKLYYEGVILVKPKDLEKKASDYVPRPSVALDGGSLCL